MNIKPPERKPNRMKAYNYSQAGAYFITICTKNRQKLLGSIVGGDAHIAPQVQLSAYGKVAHEYIRRIPGVTDYVIMPDHIHLIVHIENGPMLASAPTQSVPQRIRSFKTLVTKELKRPIWQRSFYDHVIRNEQEYRETVEYISNNPAKWAMSKLYPD